LAHEHRLSGLNSRSTRYGSPQSLQPRPNQCALLFAEGTSKLLFAIKPKTHFSHFTVRNFGMDTSHLFGSQFLLNQIFIASIEFRASLRTFGSFHRCFKLETAALRQSSKKCVLAPANLIVTFINN
jgi:hypothetical protein